MPHPNPDSLLPSKIELSKKAFQQNIAFLRSRLKDGVKFSSVIKGNAYGHGISTFIPMAEECGINHFSVFSANEADGVLKFRSNPETKIMIMGMIRDEELEWVVENEIEIYLFEVSRLESAIAAVRKVGKPANIHLQIETGMHRTGFEEQLWDAVFREVKKNGEYLQLKGLCTHFAGAESVANYYRIQNQNKQFKKALEMAETVFGEKPFAHASSSAAFLTYPEMQYDMVRIGIAQYGLWPSRETFMHQMKANGFSREQDPLKRVITWKSEVMNTKWVNEGEFIGYGNVYMAGRNMQIATVPIGYSHGFGRNLTNTGYVLIRGERAGVVGIVNMNMITVDVSDITGVQIGDEVVLIGSQGDDAITLASFSEMTNHLNYEVLTRLPASIPRVVTD
jgi:alanine racemase